MPEHGMQIPVIDISALLKGVEAPSVSAAIDDACRRHGFFGIVGHGIDPTLHNDLEEVARVFFELEPAEKNRVSMDRGGLAWRGWFPAGTEMTGGVADAKEGIYFGTDLSASDSRVQAGLLLHGPNLWPERPTGMREVIGAWMSQMRGVATAVLRGMATGLGLGPDWFEENLTADPIELFRIFRYLPVPPTMATVGAMGVGEHTDYGLLTVLAQDGIGGLQVYSQGGWVDVPPDRDVLVCNIGDMLDRMTAGRYTSTLHRVKPPTGYPRLSFPYFFDPSWTAMVAPIPLAGGSVASARPRRWDGTDLETLSGTYGEYLSAKVAKVFPRLAADMDAY